MRGSGEWLTTGQAAAIWSRVKGVHVTGKNIRRWYERRDPRLDTVNAEFRGPYLFIDRQSFLDSLRRRLRDGMAALDEEDGRESGE